MSHVIQLTVTPYRSDYKILRRQGQLYRLLLPWTRISFTLNRDFHKIKTYIFYIAFDIDLTLQMILEVFQKKLGLILE